MRKNNLLFGADKFRFYVNQYRNSAKNKAFRSKFPDVHFPPDYLMYESFQIDYEKYYNGGKNTAVWLKEIIAKYNNFNNLKILDWGCGPARVVRHLPDLLPDAEVYGTDYNAESIAWNKNNIKNVQFNLNSLEAKLPYENDFFDFIYGISIFTHLSEEKHLEWRNELTRILKPGGILLVTLQGEAFTDILSDEEKNVFRAGKLVLRGKVKEGHRTYSAFHPDEYVAELFKEMTVIEHRDSFYQNGNPQQDVWIFRK